MENMVPERKSDEIDLGQLFTKISQGAKDLGFQIIRLIALLRNVPISNKILFGVLIVVSLSVTLAYALSFKKKFYESTLILSSDYLNRRLVENALEKLNLLAAEKSSVGLAHALGVTDSVASNIIRFTTKPFVSESELIELELLKEQLKHAQGEKSDPKVVEQVTRRIEIENRHAFEITVRIYNPSIVSSLEKAIVNYFRTKEYIAKRIESNKINLENRRGKLLQESMKLDSLKGVIYANYKSMAAQNRQGSNNVILGDRAVTDPISVYNQDFEFYDELQSIDGRLFIKSDFEVVDGFTEFSEPASASLSLMLLQAALIAIGLGYLIVAAREFNLYLAKVE